jgi:cytochrome c oxidase assembly protein subunit 11
MKTRNKANRSRASADRATANRRTIGWSLLVIVLMFGFGFAMSPLYDVVCRALGIGGKTGRIDEPAAVVAVDTSRKVTVEFTGNAMAGLPWEFQPLTKKLELHPGETVTVAYLVRNPTGEKITGQAVPSVTPPLAAAHFNKIECFCFTLQTLAPGETREMPVRFVVDPKLPPEVRTITLSYGFFNTDKAQAKRFGGEAVSADHHRHAHGAAPGS